jgi:SWI/SNF-related matrix-associated actin-dependent regulator 1 of chromatin subfamily A
MDTIKRPSAADFSPDSPQPLSRLKKRYEDSPSTSPTKATGRVPSPQITTSVPSSPATPRSGVKANKLISLAKQTHNNEVEGSIKRLKTQFPGLERETYRRALERYGSPDAEGLLKELGAAKAKADAAPSSQTSASSSTSNLASALEKYRFEPGVPTKPTSKGSSPAPVPEVVRSASPAKRPRKNDQSNARREKSTIYARREKQAKQAQRRDPDEESDHYSSDDDEAWTDGSRRRKRRKSDDDIDAEGEALKAFNEAEAEVLTGTMACSEEQAEKIIKLRPYEDADDVQAKLSKARGVSFKLFEQYVEIMEGYVQIDNCLNGCDSIAQDIAQTLAVWKGAATTSDSIVGTPRSDGLNDAKIDVAKVSELLLAETDMRRKKILASYIRQQPALLSEGTVLKDYQLLGVNWLNLLYTRKIGCILADEMGLGKTIQVIAFLAHLKEHGIKGPHMIFVPASTLENWTREFERFAPDIDVVTYYGSQSERGELRDQLKRQFRAGDLEVVLASYTQVAAKDDLTFFRKKIQFETCIYDEGHALKSFDTKRYKDLLSIVPQWRLLLTGTPVQNNLQELVSLLMFIHTDMFADAEPYLRQIFKVQSASAANLLSASRTSRARTMLAPFVLRRRKANVS